MDYKNFNRRQIAQIVIHNDLSKKFCEENNCKNIKYSKKSELVNFLENQNNIIVPDNIKDYIGKSVRKNKESNTQENKDILTDSDHSIDDVECKGVETTINVQQNINLNDENEIDKLEERIDNKEFILDLSDIKNKKVKKNKIKKDLQKQIIEDPEITKEKNKAIILMNKYIERFPWIKDEIIGMDIYSDPINSLTYIERRINSRNTRGLITENFFVITDQIEMLAVNTSIVNDYIKLQGFSNNLRANQTCRDLLDELVIKYADDIGLNELSVETRFGLCILSVIYATHTNNYVQEQVKNIKNTCVNPNVMKNIDKDL